MMPQGRSTLYQTRSIFNLKFDHYGHPRACIVGYRWNSSGSPPLAYVAPRGGCYHSFSRNT
jgi:hypothetical protein